MLVELHVTSLGVIERAELVLGPGLTALTGETGAGKTMLVEAIELLTGGRADGAIVRTGADEACVEGRFVVGDDEFVLTRVVPAKGRSRAYVDGRPATVATLTERASRALELHGQHAHQALLDAAAQRDALDAYGGVDLAPMRAARDEVARIDGELAALGGDERVRAREIDLLRYQVAELDAAAIESPTEDDELDQLEVLLADAQAHREAAATAVAQLGDDGGGRDVVATALGALGDRQPFASHVRRLTDLAAELDDIVAELRAAGEDIDDDPERLEAVRERRQVLVDLRRKYGANVAEVMEFHRETAERLAELERYDERAAELDQQRAEAAAALERAAQQVGHQRRAAAPALAAAVEVRLRELAMPHASVSIDVADADPAGERVQFLLAANPGSPPLPLTKVASGGELARTMLALRLALSDIDLDVGAATGQPPATDEPLTLIFDEVDAGIGGAAATAVGRALASLGERHQVLVVTHLAQVAALATTQVTIAKRVAGGATTAAARRVDGDERVGEVARMLSGEPDNGAAREHAAELLAR